MPLSERKFREELERTTSRKNETLDFFKFFDINWSTKKVKDIIWEIAFISSNFGNERTDMRYYVPV